jgi:hypothetical protein
MIAHSDLARDLARMRVDEVLAEAHRVRSARSVRTCPPRLPGMLAGMLAGALAKAWRVPAPARVAGGC